MSFLGLFNSDKDDLRKAFSTAKSLAAAATEAAAEVERLKAALSNAIAKAADLATKAAAAALAAAEKAESRSAQFYLEAQIHADAAVYQSSQVVPAPAPVANKETLQIAPTLIPVPSENTEPAQDDLPLTATTAEANTA